MTKEDKENRKKLILEGIRWEITIPKRLGGQHCGLITPKITLIHDDLDIQITVGYHRSQHKNRESALLIFDLSLEEILV